jgi:benzoylformate decarboxylase
LWRGNLPTKAVEIAIAMQDFDAVFALGGKSFITILYSEASALPEGCELYQLSVDGRDLGRTYPSRLSVVGDIQFSLQVLNDLIAPRVETDKQSYNHEREAARETFEARRTNLQQQAEALLSRHPIHPMAAARELADAIGPIPIVDEAIATAAHLRRFLHNNATRQYSFLRGGALGWGMPAAVGFSLGTGRGPVVSLVGDGAAMYSPQALWTAMHERVPVTFVVINNREYNILKNFMRSQPHYHAARTGQFLAMDLVNPSIDFLALAASMGMPARRVSRAEDIGEALRAGIASGAPNLVEIVVDVE